MQTKQTEVKLHTCTNDITKRWYISILYTQENGRRTRSKVYLGLNFHKTVSARTKEGNNLIKFVKSQLNAGWNPELCSIEEYMSGHRPVEVHNISFHAAIDFALEHGKWAKKTKLGFFGTGKYFQDAAKAIGLAQKPVSEITRGDIKMMADKAKKLQFWTNKTYNKHINWLSAIMFQLVEYELIETNPCHRIKPLAEAEDKHFEPYTDDEKKAIHEHLYVTHYRFYVMCMVVYQTGIRPKEVLSLKISDIDIKNREIKIYPNLEEENSKTKSNRTIPISDKLLPFFVQMNLSEFPSDYYVFGSLSKSGGNSTHLGAMEPEYFSPSNVRVKRDTATKLWNKLIMNKKTGLGIKKHLYAMKHTGADDKIMAGVSLDALRDMFGHSSIFMTERYLTKLKNLHKEEIIKNSPGF